MLHPADPPESGADAIQPSPEADVFDRTVLHDLLDSLGEPVAVAALYRKFLGNAAAFIGELRDQEDAARIDTLHTLKGSAAMMGATRLAQLAMRLQAELPGSRVQVGQAMQALEGERVRFRSAAAARLLEVGASLDTPE